MGEIKAISIATSKTREQFPLSDKLIIKKTAVIVLAFAVPFLFFSSMVAGIMIPAFVMIIILAVFFYMNYQWHYQTYFYDLTPDHMVIGKASAVSREIIIPYERIQDLYVEQDFLDKNLGIYNVHISGANISPLAFVRIEGLEKIAADGLKGEILKRVQEKANKNNRQV